MIYKLTASYVVSHWITIPLPWLYEGVNAAGFVKFPFSGKYGLGVAESVGLVVLVAPSSWPLTIRIAKLRHESHDVTRDICAQGVVDLVLE